MESVCGQVGRRSPVTSVTYRGLPTQAMLRRDRAGPPLSPKGVVVKCPGLALLLLFVLLVIALERGIAATPPTPIDRTQVTAWIAGGISNARLARLAAERGVGFPFRLRMKSSFVRRSEQRTHQSSASPSWGKCAGHRVRRPCRRRQNSHTRENMKLLPLSSLTLLRSDPK